MSDYRHIAALQQAGQGSSMAIGEFGGAPVALGGGGVLLATPLYWLYETSLAALNPARAAPTPARLFFKNPANPLSHHRASARTRRRGLRTVRALDAPLRRPEWNISSTLVGAERVPVHISTVMGAAVLPAPAFRARLRASSAPAAAARADRRADVRATIRRCCAAPSRRFCPITTSTSTEWIDARMVPLAEGASISTITSTT